MTEFILRSLCLSILVLSGALLNPWRNNIAKTFCIIAIIIGLTAQWYKLQSVDLLRTDLAAYVNEYYWIRTSSLHQYFTQTNYEYGFSALAYVLGVCISSEMLWLFSMGLVPLLAIWIAASRLFGSAAGALCAGIFINYIIYISYTFVALRQGVAIGFVILAISFLSKSNSEIAGADRSKGQFFGIALMLVSPFFHSSAILGWAALPVYLITPGRLKMSRIRTISTLVAISLLAGATMIIIGPAIFFRKLEVYSSETAISQYGRIGPRWDILAVFVLVSIALGIPKRVFREYTFRKLYFCLLMFAIGYVPTLSMAYNDRVAAYGAMIFPLVAVSRCALESGTRRSLGLGIVVLSTAAPTMYALVISL